MTKIRKKMKLKVSDFLHLADILGVSKESFKKEAKRITMIFIDQFPEYIEKTKELLKFSSLEVHRTRQSKTNFIVKLAGFYNESLKEMKTLGILEEFRIEEKYKDKLKKMA